MLQKYAKPRSDEEKKEIYDKWQKLINMSQNSLNSWAENEDRLLASLNRGKAKEEGGIQSGYDSFHRIKRRKGKKFEEWTAKDFDNASQENGFNSRMLGGKPGEPVGGSGMSKWEISLKNWGHDPSLKSSPQHAKYKAWKKKHSKKSNTQRKERTTPLRNRQASIHNVLVAHQQNQMIRRAILATGNSREFDRMRRVYSMILNDGKTATSETMAVAVEQLDSSEVRDAVGVGYVTEIINKYKEKIKGINKGEIDLISNFLTERGLTKKLHVLVNAGVRPKTEYERLIASRLEKVGNFSSTLKMIGLLISARTPNQVAKVAGVGVEDLREMFGIDKNDPNVANWSLTKWDDLNKYFTSIPDHRLIVVQLGITILKASAIALLMKTALATVGLSIVKVIGVILLIVLITDTKATAQIIRKLGVSFVAIAPSVIKDLVKGFKFLKGLGEKALGLGRKLKNIFRKAAVEQIKRMLKTNPRFKRSFAYARLG